MKNPTPKILLVESDSLMREIIGRKIKNAGLEYSGLDEIGKDFVEQVVAVVPDLISLGMLFPGEIDGLEALKMIKSDPRTSKIPVFFLTNYNNAENISKAKSLGAVNYLITSDLAPDGVVEIYTKYLAGN
jgi:CheY-like chemotaxis protein